MSDASAVYDRIIGSDILPAERMDFGEAFNLPPAGGGELFSPPAPSPGNPALSVWAEVSFSATQGGAKPLALGQDSPTLETGWIEFRVYQHANLGFLEVDEVANAFRSLFHEARVGGLAFETSEKTTLGPGKNAGPYQINVFIPWWRQITVERTA